jgi:2-succinyl-6-hydroxy-2,4-cyclohexadiene-1-carboxylate synthase
LFINVSGVNYFVEVKGEGKPLLLLHGFASTHETWTDCEKYLSDGYKLIFIDLIGHGKTESPDDTERYNIKQLCFDIKYILDKIYVNNTNILGYSMGGRVALSFLMYFPEVVDKLILESCTPGLRSEDEAKLRQQSDQQLSEKILKNGIEWFSEFWEKQPIFESRRRITKSEMESIRKQQLQSNTLGLANSLLGYGTGFQPSWWENLPQISHQICIICGELDQKFCKIGKEMEKILQNATYFEVANVGHTVHLEAEEAFYSIVESFLSLNIKEVQ